MKVEKDVTVTMRDGVRISLCVYRPDAPGRFPRCSPPRPTSTSWTQVPAYPLFLWRETGPIEWYVGQGYAYVHADVRGSGHSEGEFCFMGKPEQDDYVELIAWILKQDWCNGRVGGIGQSYYAMAQWLMATYATRPASPASCPMTGWSISTAARTITAEFSASYRLGLVHVAARRQPASPGRRTRAARR